MKIKKLREDAIMPFYATGNSAAFDVSAVEDYMVYPLAPRRESCFGKKLVFMIHTGLAVAIPEGYEINVRARSGLSLKYPNYIAISGGGTIDSDYRGEIIVPVVNHTADAWLIKRGDRIAQCIVSPIKLCELILVDKLSETERGEGGFGSTGLRIDIED